MILITYIAHQCPVPFYKTTLFSGTLEDWWDDIGEPEKYVIIGVFPL